MMIFEILRRKISTRRILLGCVVLLTIAASAAAQNVKDGVKIGWLGTLSTSQADVAGLGSIEAARMAIEDFGGKALGKPVELVYADHMDKPDVGVAVAREWFERDGVDAIFDLPTSPVALAVNFLAKEEKKLVFFSDALTDKMTEEDCNGYGVAWAWDAPSIVKSNVLSQVAKGNDSWYVLTFDNATGIAIESAIRQALEGAGGKLVGVVRAPLGTTDFSSFLLKAKGSPAKVLAITLSGGDLVNAMKQVREYRIDEGRKIAVIYGFDTDIKAIGLDLMTGLEFATPFYWGFDEQTRNFGNRFIQRFGKAPNLGQAGVYSAVFNYLKAVQTAGSKDPEKVLAQLRSAEINDMFVRHGTLLPNGRLNHDMFLVRVKSPAESKSEWDQLEVTNVVPASQAFRKIEESKCPLTRH